MSAAWLRWAHHDAVCLVGLSNGKPCVCGLDDEIAKLDRVQPVPPLPASLTDEGVHRLLHTLRQIASVDVGYPTGLVYTSLSSWVADGGGDDDRVRRMFANCIAAASMAVQQYEEQWFGAR